MKIKIWDPYNEDEADASELDFEYEIGHPDLGWRLASAVESYASACHIESAGEWDSGELCVQIGDARKRFTVSISYHPVFNASEVKPK